jgi:hypothetical protein
MEGVGGAGVGGHAETVARREKLSAWLAGAVAEDVGRELNAARYTGLCNHGLVFFQCCGSVTF